MKKIVLFLSLFIFFNIFVFEDTFAGYTGATRDIAGCTTPMLTSSDTNNPSPSFSSTYTMESEYEPSWQEPDGVDEKGNPKTKTVYGVKYWITSHPDCTLVEKTELSVSNRYAGNGISPWFVAYTSSAGDSSATINIYWDYEIDIHFSYDGSSYGGGSIGTVQTNSRNPAVESNRNVLTKTYVDYDMPVYTCTIFRANGNDTCSPEKLDDASIGTQQRRLCVKYFSPHTNDGDSVCYSRIYVTHVKFAEGLNNLSVYPGFEHPLSCTAYFGDSTTRLLNENNNNFTNHVYFMPQALNGTFFIGNGGVQYPYKYTYDSVKPSDQNPIIPKYRNYFLSSDSGNNDYTITCAYYATATYANNKYGKYVPVTRVSFSDGVFSDFDHNEQYNKVKEDTIVVHNKGINKMELSAKGDFAKYDKDNSTFELEEKTFKLENHMGYYTDKDYFISGHFYDFIVVLSFSDGKTADVTNHPFVSFNTDLWYDGTPGNIPEPNSSCINDHFCLSPLPGAKVAPTTGPSGFKEWYSGFPYVGSKHRIPFNIGKSKLKMFVSAQYLHNEDHLNPMTSNRGPGKTFLRGYMNIREPIKFELFESDAGGNLTAIPKDKVTVIDDGKDARNYAAIVTYNNDDVENWSNSVVWNRDYQNGTSSKYRPFDFDLAKANHRHTVVFAYYFNEQFLTFPYYRSSYNSSSGLSNAVQTVFASPKTFNIKGQANYEGENFEGFHDEVIIRLVDCDTSSRSPNRIAFGCENRTGYEVNITNDPVPDYTTAPLPDEIKEKIVPQKKITVYYTPQNNLIKMPEDPSWETPNSLSQETSLFYDIRKFPVSGMSGSVGDN